MSRQRVWLAPLEVVDVYLPPRKGVSTEAVVYIAGRLRDNRAGGATKLNKVVFFADFTHVRRHGRPIAEVSYFSPDELETIDAVMRFIWRRWASTCFGPKSYV